MRPHQTIGVLLAAGSGRRFDPSGVRNKLTQQLNNGTPVVVQSVQNLLQVLSQVVVVVRDPQLIQQLNFAGCQTLHCPQADQGMGASLAFVIAGLLRQAPDADSVIVALGDMPFVQVQTIEQVVHAMQSGAQIAQPVYQQQGGHPVGIARCHFPALMALSGDSGARHLLQQFPVMRLEVQDPGVVSDIDFTADLNQ